MLEAEHPGVEPVPTVTRQAWLPQRLTAGPIERVAHEGMARERQVDADLMRPAGGNAHVHQGPLAAPPQHAHV